MSSTLLPQYGHDRYVVRRKIFTVLGQKFHIYDDEGGLAFYSKQKAFKLKEDIRIFADEAMEKELLVIKARSIIDFGATYDVFDSAQGGALVGSLRRKGLKSMAVDEWIFLDAAGRELGFIREDSLSLALLRRFLLGNLLPQQYTGTVGGAEVCHFKRNFNPFVSKMALDFSLDAQRRLDRRLGIVAAVLLVAVEGRQSG